MSARVVVAHPGRQHSHQLALALHERGALQGYWTGLPLSRDDWMARLQPGAVYPDVPLPESQVRVMPVGAGAHFIERRLRPGATESLLGQLGDYAADALYARWLRRAEATAVVAYENAALRTFGAARELGIRTILDAASVHHATADRWRPPAAGGWARDVRAHKDAELELADQVLVLSELARDSYVAAGVPSGRISVVPLGYDAGVFRAAPQERLGTPLRFVFVGHASYIKGLDLLFEAARRLREARVAFELVVIGDVREDAPTGVVALGKLPQAAIAAEFARADCLVLPSRCDGFGMVVAEALGSGLPSIVSEQTGAKDLVHASGAGWVVPAGDADALAARLRRCVEQPQDVAEAKRKARAAAAAWTWARYRERAAGAVLGQS